MDDYECDGDEGVLAQPRNEPGVRLPRSASGIPVGVYYSVEHANFYRVRDHCGMGMAFYTQWRDRSDDFPSLWEIQDHLGSLRGEAAAHSAAEAISQYATKRDIASKDISHWRAARR
jgi:hypothetical protein